MKLLNKLKNRNYSFRFIRNAGIAAITFVAVLIGAHSYITLDDVVQTLTHNLQQNRERVEILDRMIILIDEALLTFQDLISAREASLEKITSNCDEAIQLSLTIAQKVKQLKSSTEEKEEVQALVQKLEEFKKSTLEYDAARKMQATLHRQNYLEHSTGETGREIKNIVKVFMYDIRGGITEAENQLIAKNQGKQQSLATMTTGAILLAMFFAFFLAQALSKRVQPLLTGTEHMARGQFDYRVKDLGKDEIGQLASAFNNMGEQLEKTTVSRNHFEEISKAKSQFLSSMSHELRTPLNAIIGFSEVLRDESFGELNNKQKEYIGDIWTSGKHLLSLINDILDLSKVEAGKMELELDQVNIPLLLQGSLTMIKEKAEKHGIELKLNIDKKVLDIAADERKVKQIIYNVLSNSVKFTPQGGSITITVQEKDRDNILISIADTGIGIEDKDKHKVFEEFQQIDSTYSRQYAGTGLGMPLSKKMVELHHGKMWFESKGKNKGTCFYVLLPKSQESVKELQQAA